MTDVIVVYSDKNQLDRIGVYFEVYSDFSFC